MKILSKIENEELRAEIQKAVELEIENAKEVVRNDADLVKDYKLQGFKEAERKVLRDLKKSFNIDATDLDPRYGAKIPGYSNFVMLGVAAATVTAIIKKRK